MTDRRTLPQGWKWVKLGGKSGVADIINGSTPATDNPQYWDGDILWATPSDISKLNSIYIDNTERKITASGLASCSTTLLPAGTILLTSRAPVGNIAIANKEICTNQGFKSFKPKATVDSTYLYFAIKAIIPEIIKQSHGNTFVEITKELIQHFEIPLPSSVNEQKKIATKLEKRGNEIEKIRQAALRQKEAAEALQGAILRGEFEAKRDNWYPTSISKIADIVMGQSPDGATYNKDGIGVPLLNGPTEFGPNHPTPVQWTTAAKKLCQVGDLIVCVRASTGKMNWADQVYCLGRGVASIRGKKEKGDTLFIRYALEYKIRELLIGSERSTFPNLGKDELNAFEIYAPKDISTQENIARGLKEKLSIANKTVGVATTQLEAIEAMPAAMLREVFDFDAETGAAI